MRARASHNRFIVSACVCVSFVSRWRPAVISLHFKACCKCRSFFAPIKKRSQNHHKCQTNLKSTVISAGNISAAVVVLCAAVSGTICSSHLTSFLPVACSPALSHFSPCYSITRSQDALTLSPFSSYAASGGVWRGRARFHCILHTSLAPSHKRVEAGACGVALRKHRIHTSLRQNADNLPSSKRRQADKGNGACKHAHARARTCTHAYANLHASTLDSRSDFETVCWRQELQRFRE